MLFCNRCGQCSHISNDSFTAYRNISGYDVVYIDPENKDNVLDWGDSVTDPTSEIYDYTCSECNGQDIDLDWGGTPEQALGQRALWAKEEDDKRTAQKKKEEQENKWDK